jgi:hypothetical protein
MQEASAAVIRCFECVVTSFCAVAGALKQAQRDNKQPTSTIDDKINKRLQERTRKASVSAKSRWCVIW